MYRSSYDINVDDILSDLWQHWNIWYNTKYFNRQQMVDVPLLIVINKIRYSFRKYTQWSIKFV